MSLRLNGIVKESIVDGFGLRYVLFAQGCKHNCEGCHNPSTHNYSGGYQCEIEDILKDILKNPLLKGITLSGGEPLDQAKAFISLAKEVKLKNLDIWCFTGYTIEEILEEKDKDKLKLLKYIDVLVDGRFEKSLRTIEKPFVGSSNQRVIDIKRDLGYNNI